MFISALFRELKYLGKNPMGQSREIVIFWYTTWFTMMPSLKVKATKTM